MPPRVSLTGSDRRQSRRSASLWPQVQAGIPTLSSMQCKLMHVDVGLSKEGSAELACMMRPVTAAWPRATIRDVLSMLAAIAIILAVSIGVAVGTMNQAGAVAAATLVTAGGRSYRFGGD